MNALRISSPEPSSKEVAIFFCSSFDTSMPSTRRATGSSVTSIVPGIAGASVVPLGVGWHKTSVNRGGGSEDFPSRPRLTVPQTLVGCTNAGCSPGEVSWGFSGVCLRPSEGCHGAEQGASINGAIRQEPDKDKTDKIVLTKDT